MLPAGTMSCFLEGQKDRQTLCQYFWCNEVWPGAAMGESGLQYWITSTSSLLSFIFNLDAPQSSPQHLGFFLTDWMLKDGMRLHYNEKFQPPNFLSNLVWLYNPLFCVRDICERFTYITLLCWGVRRHFKELFN